MGISVVLGEEFCQSFGVFLAAFGFAGDVGEDTLGLGLADALAGVGFDSFDGGEGPFFRALAGALLGHMCLR